MVLAAPEPASSLEKAGERAVAGSGTGGRLESGPWAPSLRACLELGGPGVSACVAVKANMHSCLSSRTHVGEAGQELAGRGGSALYTSVEGGLLFTRKLKTGHEALPLTLPTTAQACY